MATLKYVVVFFWLNTSDEVGGIMQTHPCIFVHRQQVKISDK